MYKTNLKMLAHAGATTLLVLSFALSHTSPAEARFDKCLGGANALRELFGKRDPAKIEELRIGTFNVQDYFSETGRLSPESRAEGRYNLRRIRPKRWYQVERVGKHIEKHDLDIFVLEEVAGLQEGIELNEKHLGGRYDLHMIEGNDGRSLNILFGVKKDLPVEAELRSHKEETWTDPTLPPNAGPQKLFSRDLPALIVRLQGTPIVEKPLMVLFGTHYKSRRDRPNDPESRLWADEQIARSARIIAEYRERFGQDINIVVAGDFNNDLNQGEAGATPGHNEFGPLYDDAGLINSFELGKGLPVSDRVTHIYFPPKNQPPERHQMDGLLVSESLAEHVIQTIIPPYIDRAGNPYPLPRSFKMRSAQPSDHFMVFMRLRFQSLIYRAN